MTADATRDHEGHIGWLEHTLAGISGSIERSIFTEEHARSAGWLQGLDPRAKLGMFLAVILAASLSTSILTWSACYAVILVAAAASRIPFDFFVRRVWLGIPFFAAIVVIPAIFFVAGPAPVRAHGRADHDRAVDPGPDRRRPVRDPGRRSASRWRCCSS